MSGNPGQFKDFNKSANNFLTKVFPKKTGANTWGIQFELEPTKYFKANAKVSNTGGNSVAEFGDEITFADFGVTFKSTFKTDKPTLEASWGISEKIPVDGLSAKLHVDATDSTQTAGVSLAFEHEYFTLNARVHIPVAKALLDFVKEEDIQDQDTRFDVDFVASHPDYKVFLGALAKVASPSAGDRRIDEAKVSLGWRDGGLNTSLNYAQKSSDGKDSRSVACTLYAKPSESAYVANVDYDLDNKSTVGTVGFDYALNDGAVLKYKLDTNKNVGIAYSNKISNFTNLDFGALLAINTDSKVSIDSAFSFNLKFTH